MASTKWHRLLCYCLRSEHREQFSPTSQVPMTVVTWWKHRAALNFPPVGGQKAFKTPAGSSGHHQASGWLPWALSTPGIPGFTTSLPVWLCRSLLRSVESIGQSNSPACMDSPLLQDDWEHWNGPQHYDRNFARGFFLCLVWVFFSWSTIILLVLHRKALLNLSAICLTDVSYR